jgi:pentatricopeptide repeat protein
VNARYPDFKHKKTKQALWLNGRWNPVWVEAELEAMAPGSLQVSVFQWNRKLARCALVGQHEKTIELFQKMKQEGITPDSFTFVRVLNACASLQLLGEGRCIHSQILHNSCKFDIFVGNSLIDMYAKCGSIEDAGRVFKSMATRDVVSWNAMIMGYVICGQGHKALQLSEQMEFEGVTPDPVTFVGLLKACASLGALEEGRRIHTQIIQNSYESDIFVGSSLVDMYAKCGSIDDACRVFNKMPTRNVVSWNTMIMGHVKCGQGQKALELYQQMQCEGVQPDTVTFVGVLNACASLAAVDEGMHVHEQIVCSGCEFDVSVGNSLIDMYAKCGNLEDAKRVFRRMTTRDVVSWNAMIVGFVKCGEGHKALELFRQMQSEGMEPVPITFVGVLNACASTTSLKEGRHVHEQIMRSGCESNIFVGNSLIDMYAKCGSIEDARRVFNRMVSRNAISWNALILGYVKCGQGRKALELFKQMQCEGLQPDRVTFVGILNACASVVALEEGRCVHEQIIQWDCEADVKVSNSLIDMYSKCGSIEDAWRVFTKMVTHDVISWSAIILGYLKCGQGTKALELYQQMQSEGVQPDPVTFVGVLNACASVSALEEGRCIHKQIISSDCKFDVFVACSLIDMYSKCGSIEDAQRVFNKLPTRNLVSWNAMLGGYAMHGHAKEALEHFQQMCQEGVEVDRVTFVALLSACSHVGLVDEGLCYFESMGSVYRISAIAEHYACMVDLLGRAGHLQEAENLIDTMPFKPSAFVWKALLGACRIHGNVEMGERIAECIC